MAGNSTSSPGRSVASKVAAVLDAFLPTSRELSLNELADRTGLPLTTTYRLSCALVEWGGLERGEGGGYRVGQHLGLIGELVPRHPSLRDVASPFMHDLNEATHENVGLAILIKTHALDIDHVNDIHQAGGERDPKPGRQLPLHATAVGKILLAYAPEAFIQQVIAGGLRRYTRHTIVDPAALRRDLIDIRRAGLSFACGEMVVGRRSVAAPVFDTEGLVVAALSLLLQSAYGGSEVLGDRPETKAEERAHLRQLQELAPAIKTAAFGVTRALRSSPVTSPELPA